MQSRLFAFTLLSCALGACSSSSDDDSSAEKLAARAQLESALRDGASNAASDSASVVAPTAVSPAQEVPPAEPSDVCAARAWYGDGECDAWCPNGDARDCAPSAGGVVCAEFFSPADGFCNRDDPCGPMQDEDCAQTDPGSAGCASDRPVTPPATRGDGKCEPRSAAELKLDPDCANLVCPAIFSPADGVCNAKTACDFVIDEDCAQEPPDGGGNGSSGVVCIDIAYEANGKCEAAPGCEANDPQDCPVVCITILYPENGKCEAARGCESSDPDC